MINAMSRDPECAGRLTIGGFRIRVNDSVPQDSLRVRLLDKQRRAVDR